MIIVAGFAFAWWSYRKTLPPVAPARRRTLIALRTLGITLLLLALFELLISSVGYRTEDPILLAAFDNSESMTLLGSSDSRIAEARSGMRMLFESELASQMLPFSFSDSIQSFPSSALDSVASAKGSETNIANLFDLASDSIRSRNLGAIVIFTDGRYNSGPNPAFDAERLGLPVYVVGLGDSVEPRDISIEQLFTNDIAYVGSEQPVQVRIRSAGYDQRPAELILQDDNGVVARQPVTILPGVNEYTANFLWTPRTEGTARLKASIQNFDDELTGRNNSQSSLVRVKSNKRRYIMISGSPNPDFAFMKRRLQNNPEVELLTFVQRDGTSFLEGTLSPASFNDAETVVLIDYPTKESNRTTVEMIASTIRRGNIPLLTILGGNVDYEKLTIIEDLLPVKLGRTRTNETQVFTDITPSGENHPATGFSDSGAWSRMPPIFKSETTFSLRPESEMLATARIGSSRLDEPLIVSRKVGKSRSLMVVGYGIWRWDLIGEGKAAAAGREELNVLDNFANSTLRWLAVREDEQQVKITTSKKIYNLGESVRFLGQVYDESYQPVNNAAVKVQIEGPNGSTELTLAPSGSGRYEGILSGLPAGDYRFSGDANVGDKKIGSDAGRFVIDEVGIEFIQTSMNVSFLRALAERTGGKFYTVNQLGSLVEDIRQNKKFTERSIEQNEEWSMRESIWFLIAALLCFSVEWFIRKRSGML
ncbi:MAG: hypothetical protein AB7H80_11430 [Candidatus Kapaibacterium sp.]